jgi:GrpB-like predicted nucleotidyltransferase (UPF0157 family)
MLGLQRGSVQLVPYTSAWVTLFEAERARLYDALHPHALDIQHIGSTAVPGLSAKPLLDIGIAVADEAIVIVSVPRITTLGYMYRGYRGADQGYFFDLGSEPHLTHYLHLLLISDPGWWNYLRFRDYLRAHPAARAAYQQLKQDLATQYATDRAAYSAAKTTFIQDILTADSSAE